METNLWTIFRSSLSSRSWLARMLDSSLDLKSVTGIIRVRASWKAWFCASRRSLFLRGSRIQRQDFTARFRQRPNAITGGVELRSDGEIVRAVANGCLNRISRPQGGTGTAHDDGNIRQCLINHPAPSSAKTRDFVARSKAIRTKTASAVFSDHQRRCMSRACRHATGLAKLLRTTIVRGTDCSPSWQRNRKDCALHYRRKHRFAPSKVCMASSREPRLRRRRNPCLC